MVRKYQSFMDRPMMQAATQLPVLAPAKVKSGQVTHPDYLKTARPTTAPLSQTDRRLATTDVTTLRAGSTTWKIIQDFVASSPDMSSAVFSYLRTAITSGYKAYAKNPDGSFQPEATALVNQLTNRMDMLPGYDQGFASSGSLRSLSEQLGKQLLLTGGMMGELVLDKTRLPSFIQPISITNIKWIADAKGGFYPRQSIAGKEIDLDIPTVFYVALDQDLLELYASSPLESALKPLIASEMFIADLQRVMKRAIHPRIDVEIDLEKLREIAPPDAQHDQTKFAEFLNTTLETVKTTLSSLQPEDAFVHFDFLTVTYNGNGNVSISNEYTVLNEIFNAKMSTGAKTMPAILGHGAGSQNVASTESLLFVKSVAGALQYKLNEFYSRVFTLAVRLFGYDVTVTFEYDKVDLRPDSELETFRAVKQSRILELLSLGLVSDEEASIELTGRLPPKGMKPLTGTMFKTTKAKEAEDTSSNGGSALNKDLNSGKGGVKSGNTKANSLRAFGDNVITFEG